MAIIKSNLLGILSGKLGDFIFRRTANGVVIARRPAKSKRPISEATRRHRERFCRATKFAAQLDDQQRIHYAEMARKQKLPGVHAAAVRDYMKKTEVD